MSRNDTDRESGWEQLAMFVEPERDAFAAAFARDFDAVCRRGVDPERCPDCSRVGEIACECGGRAG